jgi:microcompartment protein CcmL/EutN
MEALGMLELSSIAVAFQVEDAMLKAADVELLVARTICSGKYMVMIGGQVAAVESSLRSGTNVSREALIDELLIPDVDPRVFPAITGGVALRDEDKDALGILSRPSPSRPSSRASTRP